MSKERDDAIHNYCMHKIGLALNRESGSLSYRRQDNLKAYRMEPYGDERPGFSKFVSSEVFEAVEWTLPNVLDVFFATDSPVEFRARTDDMEEIASAKQETNVVNYFLRERDGAFLELQTWFKDTLLQQNAYVMVYWDEREETEVHEYKDLSDDELDAVTAERPGVTVDIIDRKSRKEKLTQEIVDPMTGQPLTIEMTVTKWDVKLRRTYTESGIRIEGWPPEDVLVEKDHTTLDLDDADFVGIRQIMSFSELVKRGVSPERLEGLATTGEEKNFQTEIVVRRETRDEQPELLDHEHDEPAGREYLTYCCYVKFDYDEDGIAERRKVFIIGPEVVENEETGYQPMVATSAIPQSHRHVGMAWVDAVYRMQHLSSTLWRQLLTNAYRMNIQRKFINQDMLLPGGLTLDYMNNTQSEYVFVNGIPHQQIYQEQPASIIAEIQPILDRVEAKTRKRAGSGPEIATDPSVLEQTTAHGILQAVDSASQRLTMLIRTIAETGYKKLACKIHTLLRMHQDEELFLEINGEYTRVNPLEWDKRDKLKINVGLGHASKQATLQILMQLLPLQQQAMGAGLANPKKIYNLLDKLVDAADVGYTPEFFIDPEGPEFQPPPPPPPDPAAIAAQAQMKQAEAKMLEAQSGAQTEQMEAQTKQYETQAKLQLDEIRITADAREKEAKAVISAEELQRKYELELEKKAAEIKKLEVETANLRVEMAQTQIDMEKTVAETDKTIVETEQYARDDSTNGEARGET